VKERIRGIGRFAVEKLNAPAAATIHIAKGKNKSDAIAAA
jgi:hypothetical protein